jgi:prophage regulatory protein
MTKSEVAAVLRCCERTIERQVKSGEFPPPVRFGKESVWFESVVYGWLDLRRMKQLEWAPALPSSLNSVSAGERPAAVPQSTSVSTKGSRKRARPWEGEAAAQPVFQAD